VFFIASSDPARFTVFRIRVRCFFDPRIRRIRSEKNILDPEWFSLFTFFHLSSAESSDTDSRSEDSGSDAEVPQEGNRARFRYARRKRRKVKDLASCLNPENYTLLP